MCVDAVDARAMPPHSSSLLVAAVEGVALVEFPIKVVDVHGNLTPHPFHSILI